MTRTKSNTITDSDWDPAFWFAVLSPVLGILVGFLAFSCSTTDNCKWERTDSRKKMDGERAGREKNEPQQIRVCPNEASALPRRRIDPVLSPKRESQPFL
jgi:hypothetical protein